MHWLKPAIRRAPIRSPGRSRHCKTGPTDASVIINELNRSYTLFRAFMIASTILGLTACNPSSYRDNIDTADPLSSLLPWDSSGEGVQVTDSGLEYLILTEGPEDGLSPTPQDRVQVMYDGRLNDGAVFDSSYERNSPASFGVSQVIPGWTEGLQLMSEGDEFIFYIPNELAYGNQARGDVIKAGDDLVFRVELQQVIQAPKPRETDTAAWDQFTPWDSAREGVQSTGTGLEYVELEAGPEDGASPQPGDIVVVYYEGRLDSTGLVFDSAYSRGQAALLQADRVIPGWVEALAIMRPGDRWLVHLPAQLAYGDTGYGDIPADAALNFEIELMDVVRPSS